MMSLPIVWITIPRRTDRSEFFYERNVKRFPFLNWIRFNGFDPIWHKFASLGCSETDGHCGCWLSHYGAWQVGAVASSTGCIFLEDDVTVADDFELVLAELSRGNQSKLLHLDPENMDYGGTYGYYVPHGVLISMVNGLVQRNSHLDHQILHPENIGYFSRKIVTHHAEILSETCEFTWREIHGRLPPPDR